MEILARYVRIKQCIVCNPNKAYMYIYIKQYFFSFNWEGDVHGELGDHRYNSLIQQNMYVFLFFF